MISSTPMKRWRLAGLAAALTLALLAPAITSTSSASAGASAPRAARTSTPDTLALAGPLAEQELEWLPCQGAFTTNIPEDVRTQLENWPNLECAWVRVPQDWKHPRNGKTLRLLVDRVTNLSPGSPAYRGTILINPGGPGGEGVQWAPNIFRRAPELAANFNSFGMDPRGVGFSDKPSCPGYINPFDASDGKIYNLTAARVCSAVEDVSFITSEQTAYDFDFVRGLLGVDKVTYIGYSYGTWLGTWYGSIFGENIARMILDSALDATMDTMQGGWDLQPVARDRQFRDVMIPYTARHVDGLIDRSDPGTALLSPYFPRTAAGVKTAYWTAFDAYEAKGVLQMLQMIWSLTEALSAFPDPSKYPAAAAVIWMHVVEATRYYVERGEVPPWVEQEGGEVAAVSAAARAAAAIDPYAEVTQAKTPRAVAKAVLSTFGDQMSADGRAYLEEQIPTFATSELDAADEGEPEPNNDFYTAFDAIRCGDGQWTQGEAYWDQWDVDIKAQAPFTRLFGNLLYPACAAWPTDNPTMPTPDQRTFPDTIVIQGEEDSQTGWEGGYTMGTRLPNTKLIALDNATKHGYFPYGTSCVDSRAVRFLLTGAQPQRPVSICSGKPLPDDTVTYEMWSPLNVNGKHVDGAGFSTRVEDPETAGWGWTISEELARAETDRLLDRFRR